MSFPPPPPPPPPGGHFPTPPALFKYTSQQRQVDHQVSMQQQQQQLQQQPPPPTFNTTSSLPRNIYQQQAPPPAMNGMHHTPPQYYSNPPHVPSASYVQAQNLLPPPHYPPPPPRMMHSAPIMMPTPPPPSFTTIQQPSGNAHALDHPGSTRPYPPPPGPPIFGSHPPAPIDRGLPSPPMQQLQQPPPMQQQKQPPNDHRKIDPSQIPRPPLFTRPQTTSQPIPIYFPRRAMELDEIQVPPPADSRTLCQDDGNASPHLLRSTMYAIPRDRNMANKLGIDFAILCTPLALPSHDFVPRPRIYPDGSYADGDDDGGFDPQRIPLTSMTPSRCRNCHAYANAYWGQDGTCNFCGSKNNDIQPTQYGTVDYQVNGPYVTRENPVGATSIYALDATCPHLRTYVEIITLVGIQMGEHYQRQQGPFMAKPRIGCVLVSSFGVGISYFTDSSGELAYSVMSDVTEDPFCHLPLEQWTYDVSTDEGVEAWKLCMSKVLILWQHSLKEIAQGAKGYASSCGGAALAFMADALKDCGGRATWISWRRPNFGVGLIRDRELNNLQFYTNESSERPLYCPLQLQRKLQSPEQTTADFYKKLGQDCSRNRICVDIIMHTLPKPMAFLDFGTLGELCRKSSGTLKWIRAPDWKEQFREELCRPILSFVGTDVIFKVRSSEGIEVKSYLSSTAPGTTVDGGIVGSPELELSAVLPNTCIAVELEHRVGGINKKQRLVYIQVATLYTAINGRRRVRVSTLALRVSSDPLDIFRCSDFGAYTALLSRQAVNHLWTANDDRLSTLDAARQDLMKKCTHLLAKYRLHAQTSPSPTGQLLLPTKFQLLPLYVMSLMKSAILRSALPPRNSEVRVNRASPNADDRAYALFHAASVTPACAMLLVHPNIFPLTNLFDGAGDWQIPLISNARSDLEQAAYHAFVQLPNSIHPSIASMEDENIYLIDDGINLFIFVGHDAPKDIKAEIIESDSDKGCRVSTSSDVGLKVYRLLWQMRTHVSVGGGSESSLRPSYPPCIVVLQHPSHKDPFDDMVMKLMVDDTISGCGNYTNFLVDMHHRVRTEVENGTTRNF